MHIMNANFDVGFRRLEAMQVCVVLEFLRNNIECNFNIAILPNIYTQTRNIALLGPEFSTKNSFGGCVGNFWDLSTVFRGHTGIH